MPVLDINMTRTTKHDRYSPLITLVGHSGHSGHSAFAHTYARAGTRKRPKPLLSLFSHSLMCQQITMTTMTTMTRVRNTKGSAVTLFGHTKKSVTTSRNRPFSKHFTTRVPYV